ncbi:unnamed protein product, partial [Effrenium voratum]
PEETTAGAERRKVGAMEPLENTAMVCTGLGLVTGLLCFGFFLLVWRLALVKGDER